MMMSNSGTPKNLHQWAIGRLVPVAMIAQQCALNSEFVTECLHAIRQGELQKVMGYGEPERSWFQMYRRPQLIREIITGEIAGETPATNWLVQGGLTSRGQNPTDACIKTKLLPKADLQHVAQTMSQIYIAAYWEHLEALVQEENDDAFLEFGEKVHIPSMRYFLLVWIPCLFEYGVFASSLYASCRRGNVDALDKLLRLDPSVMFDCQVAKHITRWLAQGDTVRVGIINKASQSKPHGKLNRQNVNVISGAYARNMSRLYGQELSYEDIRSLI
ncbi:MAG: hypothetical protein JKX85_15615 [Phycisphaeraceae bacterium]|nr:hypothetical protein [Phycisphaeraceae bacterium]